MKKKSHPIIEAMKPVAEALGKMLGPNCEVAIHDLTHPQHSIVFIINGQVTGRKEGDPLGNLFSEFLQLTQLNQDMLINYADVEQGKKLKCTKVLIRDELGKVIGCLCINMQIHEYLDALSTLQKICKTIPIEEFKGEQMEEEPTENIFTMVKDIINNAIDDVASTKEKIPRDEKIAIVKFLDEKGVFRVKGAIDWVAKKLNVSRFSIYSYLDQSRSEEPDMDLD